jgi:hypothetical protein
LLLLIDSLYLQSDGLADAKDAVKRENPKAYKRLRRTLRALGEDVTTYLMYSRGSSGGAGAKTKLDKDRKKLCETQMERVSTKAGRIRKEACEENVKYKLRESRAVLNTIRHLSREVSSVRNMLPSTLFFALFYDVSSYLQCRMAWASGYSV